MAQSRAALTSADGAYGRKKQAKIPKCELTDKRSAYGRKKPVNIRKTKGLRVLFTMVGGVVGAGFVSGRELLQFFGCYRISAVYYAGLLFFLCFVLFVRLGKNFGGFEGVLKGVFGRISPFVKIVILFGSFVSSVGMLSASNALIPAAKPFISLAFLVFSCFVSEKGVGGIGTVNLIIMPALLVSVFSLVLSKGALSSPEPPAVGFSSLISVFLYVSMNTFLSMPVLCDLGAEMKTHSSFLCLLSAFIIAFSIGFILSAVCSDKNSYACDLPLSYVLDGAKIFSLLAAGGMLTTLISSFYPLYSLSGRRWGVAGKISLAALTEVCSFAGFKSIVATVYPALGIFGIAVTAVSAIAYLGSTSFKKRVRAALPKKREKKVKFSAKQMNDFY